MGRIEWIDISELPEEFRDGRELLLWERGVVLGRWDTRGDHDGFTFESGLTMIDWPTHFAEINPPGEQDPGIPMFGMRTEK